MIAVEENNLIVRVIFSGQATYLDVIKDGKTTRRKVAADQYGEGWVFNIKQCCNMTDDQTGLSVSTKGWKSVNGSYKHAAEDLVRKIITDGFL